MKKIRSSATAFLGACALLCATVLGTSVLPAQAADTTRTITYLGVLVEFPDFPVELDDAPTLSVLEKVTKAGGDVVTGTNASAPITPLAEYVSKYSYGSVKVDVDFFPKAADGKTPKAVTAPKSRGYYMAKSDTNPDGYASVAEGKNREEALLKHIVTQVGSDIAAAHTRQTLDSDNDGVLDAITFFAAGAPNFNTSSMSYGKNYGGYGVDQPNGPLWPHSTTSGYLGTISGLNVSTYNVNNTMDPSQPGSMFHYSTNMFTKQPQQLADGSYQPDRTQYTVMHHEFMHTFGVKDLYRSTTSTGKDEPVDFYSLMATQDPYDPQPPLAYESSVVLEWSSPIPTLDADKEAQVCKAQYTDRSEKRAVKIVSPINPKQYFVVDYYDLPENAVASKRGVSDGVLVYRVNSDQWTNLEGSSTNPAGDAVYIYRPGETVNGEANNRDGNLAKAVRTAGTTVGKSLDETSGWDADALYFADGSNSGIKISLAAGDQADCMKVSYTAPSVQGDGTKNNPYIISNAAEWNNYVNDNVYVQLAGDIDFAGAQVPAKQVDGLHLDGKGHTLSNFSTKDGGLFDSLIDVEIKNLNISGITTQGADGASVGAFASSMTSGTVSNVHVLSGTVAAGTPSQYGVQGAGGFIGSLTGGTISGCSTAADVTSGQYRGGFLGIAQKDAAVNGSVASGKVTDQGAKAAGGFYGASMQTALNWAEMGDATYSNNLYLVTNSALTTAAKEGDKQGIVGVQVSPTQVAVEEAQTAKLTVNYCHDGNSCSATQAPTGVALTSSTADEDKASINSVTITGVKAGETNATLRFTSGSAVLNVTVPVTVTAKAVDPTVPVGDQPADDVEETLGQLADSTDADAKNCQTQTVKQVQEKTTVTTPYTWDTNQQKWVLDTANARTEKSTVEAGDRAMSEEEKNTCPATDYSKLREAIQAGRQSLEDAIISTDGKDVPTDKTWTTQAKADAFKQILDAAEQLADQGGLTVGQVATMHQAVNQAGTAFVQGQQPGTQQPSVDLSLLKQAILGGRQAIADAIISVDGSDVPPNKTWTTKEAVAAFETILDAAQEAVDAGGMSATEVEQMRQLVSVAGGNFVNSQKQGTKTEKPEPVDTTALQTVITAGRQSLEDAIISTDGTDVPTDKTWTTQAKADAFKTILDDAQAAVDSGTLSAAEVETMRQLVVVAGTNFVKGQVPGTKTDKPEPVDTTALQTVITAGRQSLEDAIISTDGTDVAKTKTWTTQAKADAFKKILDEAQAAVDSGDLSAAEVDAMRQLVVVAGTNFVKSQQPGTKSDKPVDPKPETPTVINDLVAPTSNVDADATDPASCTVKPFVVITEREGVAYTFTVDGENVSVVFANGVMRYEYPYGSTATVTATAKDGYAFADGATTQWSWTAPTRDSLKCDSPGSDTPQQPQADTPKAQEKPTALPRTGSNNVARLTLLAALAIITGGIAVRRRTS